MSDNASFFTSYSLSDWSFISFLCFKITDHRKTTIKDLQKLLIEFHQQLDKHQQATKDPKVKAYLGRVKQNNHFNKKQLMECLDKARSQHQTEVLTSAVNIDFGSNNNYQIGDNNTYKNSQSSDIGKTSNSKNQGDENVADSAESDTFDKLFDSDDDVSHEQPLIVDRQKFRTQLFDLAYKMLRNECSFQDIADINQMKNAVSLPITIGDWLDDMSYSLLQKDSTDNDLLKLTLSRIIYFVNGDLASPVKKFIMNSVGDDVWKKVENSKRWSCHKAWISIQKKK
ncbi:hypothetical protein BDA99DRAFT_4986 [Phascolomyces articulosus]|uniref:Uncharacterized protein n=1 Tax=Phascolomyces articulosus TaxID=60185 RepID=A0AAD5PK83_9FUNG|nr:hypothetical protein BDA99DRAFT_4986 [Phascolomyces articulosus]